jgi:hypothetical protein
MDGRDKPGHDESLFSAVVITPQSPKLRNARARKPKLDADA